MGQETTFLGAGNFPLGCIQKFGAGNFPPPQKNICQSTNTLNTDRSLAQLSEMLTIQDYQSCMESVFGTEAAPTLREQSKQEPLLSNNLASGTLHGKNQPSFCRTQNITEMLRNMQIEESLGKDFIESASQSLNTSIYDPTVNTEMGNSIKKANKQQLIQAIEAQQKRGKINISNKTGKFQNLQLGKLSGMVNIFQAKSREKTPIGGGDPVRSFQFILNSSNPLKKKSEPRKDERKSQQYNKQNLNATSGNSEQAQNFKVVQQQLGEYQQIIKDQRSELDQQRKMNEKLKKVLQTFNLSFNLLNNLLIVCIDQQQTKRRCKFKFERRLLDQLI